VQTCSKMIKITVIIHGLLLLLISLGQLIRHSAGSLLTLRLRRLRYKLVFIILNIFVEFSSVNVVVMFGILQLVILLIFWIRLMSHFIFSWTLLLFNFSCITAII
jgi:hypothetical protein